MRPIALAFGKATALVACCLATVLVRAGDLPTSGSSPSPAEPDDCVSRAAKYHKVPSLVFRAILNGESGMNPRAINRSNANGTIDVGVAQINSMHFGSLQRYGIQPEDLLNGCTGSYVGAWMLAKNFKQFGNTWEAVGAYHSASPDLRNAYANSVFLTLVRWRVLPPGPMPFPDDARSSAEAVKRRKSAGIPRVGSGISSDAPPLLLLTE